MNQRRRLIDYSLKKCFKNLPGECGQIAFYGGYCLRIPGVTAQSAAYRTKVMEKAHIALMKRATLYYVMRWIRCRKPIQ